MAKESDKESYKETSQDVKPATSDNVRSSYFSIGVWHPSKEEIKDVIHRAAKAVAEERSPKHAEHDNSNKPICADTPCKLTRAERKHAKQAKLRSKFVVRHATAVPSGYLDENEEDVILQTIRDIESEFLAQDLHFSSTCPELTALKRAVSRSIRHPFTGNVQLSGFAPANIQVNYTSNTDNFTTCTIVYCYRGICYIWSGASRRHPRDKYNPKLGQVLALQRAVRSKCTKFETESTVKPSAVEVSSYDRT